MLLIETLARRATNPKNLADRLDALVALKELLDDMTAVRETHATAVQAAQDEYNDDGIEIDDDPLLSVGDNGVWVSAWVYVQTDPDLPKPPPGYSAEELERDNPYNQWMHE